MTIQLQVAPAPAASVIICTAHRPERLERGLTALAAESAQVPVEVVIVLNDADSEVVAFVENRVSGATVLRSDEKLGFAAGTNLGRTGAHAPLLLLHHDDTVLRPGALAALIAAADRHPEAGLFGPLVLDMQGRVKNAGPVLFADGSSASPLIGADPSTAEIEPRATDYCGSSCLLVRAELWDAYGGLDERFYPGGYVDVDMAFAARRLGWSVRFEPSASACHDDGSLRQGFKEWVHLRNRQQFVAKWAEELADHQPPGDDGATIERAVARAAQRGPAADGPGPAPPHGSRPRWEELREAYVADLEAALATRRDEVAHRDSVLAGLAAALERSEAHVAALVADLESLNRAAAVDAAEIRRLRQREAALDALLAER